MESAGGKTLHAISFHLCMLKFRSSLSSFFLLLLSEVSVYSVYANKEEERMGSQSSKDHHKSTPAPSLPTAITTTATTSFSTTTEVMITRDKSIFDNPEFVYILVACISAVLLTMLVFTTIYFIRKRKKKDHNTPQKTSQEQDPADTGHQAPAENTQAPASPNDEITYASLIFK